jgi:hypothetical protein
MNSFYLFIFFLKDELTAETVKNGFTFKPVDGLLEVMICFSLCVALHFFIFSMKVSKAKIFLRTPMKVFWIFLKLFY